MKILYLHGLGAKPGSVKPTFLTGQGALVVNPGMPDDDFDESVRIAQRAFDESRPNVVVGSSRGGAVAMAINSGETPLVLIAPAWKRLGRPSKVKPNTIILHSELDELIPIADSRELIANSGLPNSSLIVVGSNHYMTDEPALQALLDAIGL